MTGMLASVTTLREAQWVWQAGVDIIDLKQPAQGALGALPRQLVSAVVMTLGRRAATKFSATIGDLPMQPELLYRATTDMAATGVDYVKVGLFASNEQRACLQALRPLTARGINIVIVLLADQQPDFTLLSAIAEAGCSGAMLDTADKTQGRLTDCLSQSRLAEFVEYAKSLGLLTGLAGSLNAEDIAALLPLQADYLGFRGALCDQSQRTAAIDPAAVARIRSLIPQAIRTTAEVAS